MTLIEAPFGFEGRPYQTWEICPVCFWEDEDWRDDETAGGANSVRLSDARKSFQEFGAIERRFVEWTRPPLPNERPS
jgi:hypothetical protein